MKPWIIPAAIVVLMSASQILGDVVIDIRTKEIPPTTRPDSANFSASVLAVPGHRFDAQFQLDGQSVHIAGSVESLTGDHYRVHIDFALENGGSNTCSTSVEVQQGVPLDLFGIKTGDWSKTFVMTLKKSKN